MNKGVEEFRKRIASEMQERANKMKQDPEGFANERGGKRKKHDIIRWAQLARKNNLTEKERNEMANLAATFTTYEMQEAQNYRDNGANLDPDGIYYPILGEPDERQ